MSRKQKMKVYHGVPKSITDEYTLFYKETPYTETLLNMPTGYGSRTTGATATTKYASPSEITVDFWLYAKNLKSSASGWLSIVNSVDSQEERQFAVVHDQCNLFVFYPNFNWNNGYKVPLNQYTHVRVTCTNNKVTIYINGKVYFTNTSTGFNPSATIKRLYMLSGSHDSLSEIYLADIHVSTIDRGDYFPNLPKDFIEGKAVIKPRMGQQQIKGDPMYSQVTKVKIPTFNTENSKLYCLSDDKSKGYLRNNPEVFDVISADTWVKGSSFKLKGLNREIVSGTIDTDTAICRVTKDTIINGSTATIEVDDTSKLAIGDTIKLFDKYLTPGNAIYTITSITDTSFTADLDMSVTNIPILANNHYFMETTASSSSPIVKRADGTNVVGTWSGLGTNEATFTLGENTDIKGKDLYVEYSLTMPYGNSDFPEIPYEVERAWGENGVEMTPVDKIIIVDDFRGKIIGDVTECPHFMGWHFESTLGNPDTFSENDKQAHYTFISSLDGNTRECETTNINEVPQQIFRFNLIEVIERKLGCEIPNRDKIQWLKDNISYLGLRWYGYGSNYQGNKAQCEVYLVDSQTYTSTGKSNTTSTISLCQLDVSSSTVPRVINNNGYVSFIAFTTATDGNTPSRICTDYVILDMILKHDSNYTSLYCSNQRAREDKCNPVLIQKETKTVKRYLPSKECFTTENKYSECKNVGAVSDLDVIINKYFNIGVSTSEFNKFVKSSKINLNQFPLEKLEHLYSPISDFRINSSIPKSIGVNITEILSVHWWSDNGDALFTIPTTASCFKTCVLDSNAIKGQRGGYKDTNNNIIIYGDIDTSSLLNKDGVRLYDLALVNKNGELMLYVIKASTGNRFYFYNDAIALMKLPNRPLIK